MNTEISFTFRIDIAFKEAFKNLQALLDDAATETLAYKDWWAVEHFGFLLIAVGYESTNDDTLEYYSARRPSYKQKYVAKSPLYGDRTYFGYSVIEHRISSKTYQAVLNSSSDKYGLLMEDLSLMLDKMRLVEKKTSAFELPEFKRIFLEAVASKT
jgi:hypothetical protein